MATCQTIIERALLRAGDTDALGRTKVELLSDLNHLVRDLYEYVVTWRVDGVTGMTQSSTSISLSSGIGTKPSDCFEIAEVWYNDDRVDYAPKAVFDSITYGPVWTHYSATQIGFKPTDADSIDVYYYPTLSTMDLTDDFPGGGRFDNLAEQFLVLKMLEADRDNDLDIKTALTLYMAERQRVFKWLVTKDGYGRTIQVIRKTSNRWD